MEVVSVADRMDTIAGCFAINQEPTGAADPYALRRHALAIIRIIEKTEWEVSLGDLISKALGLLKEVVSFDEDVIFRKIADFFRERFRNMMLGQGHKADLVEAVISTQFDQVAPLRSRMEQLKKFMDQSEEFSSLVLTAKRVNNILKNQVVSKEVDTSLFKDPCEEALWDAFQELREEVQNFMEVGEYSKALHVLIRLRQPVDAFFDGVEILKKDDPQLKENRVGVLRQLSNLFLSVADFSKFAI